MLFVKYELKDYENFSFDYLIVGLCHLYAAGTNVQILYFRFFTSQLSQLKSSQSAQLEYLMFCALCYVLCVLCYEPGSPLLSHRVVFY